MSRKCCAGKKRTIRKSLVTNKKQESKIVFLGESGVGKSSIILQYMRNEFSEAFEVTIGGAFLQTQVKLEDGESVTLDIWDTAGQERYKSLLSLYYRDAVAAVIVYDVTDPATFQQLEYWASVIQQHEPLCNIFLVGNKCEVEDSTQIEEKLREYAEDKNLPWFLTSAKTKKNINELFTSIARLIKAMPQTEILSNY